MPILAGRPPAAQILCDGFTHVGGHWQLAFMSTLPVHVQATGIPVAVFELERDDLVSAKPQTRQEQQHGAIAQTERRSPITAVDRTLRVLG
jgi:hypothetical protein